MLGRIRRRYILVKIESDEEIDRRSFLNAVWSSILRLFGEYGASQTELALIEYRWKERSAILRCSHRALEMVKSAIAAITRINGKEATIHILLVSGTLKSLRRKSKTIFAQEKQKQYVTKK